MSTHTATEKIMALHVATGLPVLQAREFLQYSSEEMIERILLAASKRPLHRQSDGKSMSGLEDPIEVDPIAGPIVKRVKEEMRAALLYESAGSWPLGMCYRFWQLTKERLMDRYGITWYSPSEMNPGSFFD